METLTFLSTVIYRLMTYCMKLENSQINAETKFQNNSFQDM